MKKVVSILLCMCALLGMLCGCESDPKNTETTSANSGNQSGMIMIPMPDFTCYDENAQESNCVDIGFMSYNGIHTDVFCFCG